MTTEQKIDLWKSLLLSIRSTTGGKSSTENELFLTDEAYAKVEEHIYQKFESEVAIREERQKSKKRAQGKKMSVPNISADQLGL